MGTFNFRNKNTGKEHIFTGSIAEAEEYEKLRPDMEWMPSRIGGLTFGAIQPPIGTRDYTKYMGTDGITKGLKIGKFSEIQQKVIDDNL